MSAGIKKFARQLGEAVSRSADYRRLVPTNMLLYLTYRCTSRCRPCSMWQRPAAGPELSPEDWRACIDAAEGFPIRYVELFGGDALLRRDALAELARHVRAKGIPAVDLTTNGNLMNPEYARDLVASGLDPIIVSCDGVGELHDRVRGAAGSFERVENTLKWLRQARGAESRPQIVVNCTVSALNVDGFERVLDCALENKADTVAFEYVGEFPPEAIAASVVGGAAPEPYFARKAAASLRVDREQARRLKRAVRELKERSRTLPIKTVTVNIDTLSIAQLVSGRMPHTRCRIIRTHIIVDPLGNVLPCPFFNTYSIGNIKRERLMDIWGNERHRVFVEHADNGRIGMCAYCILGVERNRGLMASLMHSFRRMTRAGKDE